ncbi:MAG TPA: glycosyltransferase family 2 protein [Ruania sp.]|nr:glycosyltransferase family 2 protein [Ruania sp.]
MADPLPEEQARPGVDVVIAVHTPDRPIARAVRSVLDHNGEGTRLTVVCHNIDAAQIRSQVDPAHREQVRWLEHHDGKRRPAGPFNAGIEAATGEYVAIMGSDDTLQPGAISSWYWLAQHTGAEAVIARLERDGRAVPTPPTRPWRRRDLDGVKDRLCYRSAPLGLVATATIARLGLRLDEAVATGDDVGFVTRLWFQATVAFDRRGPAYVIGEDASDRITYAPRPVAEELTFLTRLLRQHWFTRLDLVQRRAAVVKYLRIHLFGAVYHRPDPETWTDAERADLAEVARALLQAAPGCEAVLSLADRALLDAILADDGAASVLISLAMARRRHGRPGTILTRDLAHLFAREAPLRMMTASVLTR